VGYTEGLDRRLAEHRGQRVRLVEVIAEVERNLGRS
jgi:hypothetical protein